MRQAVRGGGGERSRVGASGRPHTRPRTHAHPRAPRPRPTALCRRWCRAKTVFSGRVWAELSRGPGRPTAGVCHTQWAAVLACRGRVTAPWFHVPRTLARGTLPLRLRTPGAGRCGTEAGLSSGARHARPWSRRGAEVWRAALVCAAAACPPPRPPAPRPASRRSLASTEPRPATFTAIPPPPADQVGVVGRDRLTPGPRCVPGAPPHARPPHVADEVASVPVPLQTVKPAADRANPRIGVGVLAFSPDSSFLATRNGQCHSGHAVRRPRAVLWCQAH